MSPEAKLDLILSNQQAIQEGINLILELLVAEDPDEDDGFDMQTVGPEQ